MHNTRIVDTLSPFPTPHFCRSCTDHRSPHRQPRFHCRGRHLPDYERHFTFDGH